MKKIISVLVLTSIIVVVLTSGCTTGKSVSEQLTDFCTEHGYNGKWVFVEGSGCILFENDVITETRCVQRVGVINLDKPQNIGFVFLQTCEQQPRGVIRRW